MNGGREGEGGGKRESERASELKRCCASVCDFEGREVEGEREREKEGWMDGWMEKKQRREKRP